MILDVVTQTNSTTYADLLGVQVGLDRLPGETAADFIDRMHLAVTAGRGAEYTGLINELNLQFGLSLNQAFEVSSVDDFELTIGFGSLKLGNAVIELVTLTSDDFWAWKQISAVVDEINALGDYTAVLLGADGPALTLARQSNTLLVSAEPIEGRVVRLQKGRMLAASASFNQAVSGYMLGPDGRTLHFESPVPDGTEITYRYRVCPFRAVASPIACFSLLDPALHSKALGSNGKLIYQVREYLDELLERDRSYWAK